MKAPQYKPTIEELVEELGAIKSTTRPNLVGLVVNNRILWVDINHVLLVEENMSAFLIAARDRKKNPPVPCPQIKVPEKEDSVFEAPPMTFIPEETLREEDVAIVEGTCDRDLPQFDMGRAAEKKVLGEEEAETLELPSWLDKTQGLATGRVSEEGWED